MYYENMVPGIFLARPNRFIAHVEIGGSLQICHVKNTGRCRELLVPGAKVWCQESANPVPLQGDSLDLQKTGFSRQGEGNCRRCLLYGSHSDDGIV